MARLFRLHSSSGTLAGFFFFVPRHSLFIYLFICLFIYLAFLTGANLATGLVTLAELHNVFVTAYITHSVAPPALSLSLHPKNYVVCVTNTNTESLMILAAVLPLSCWEISPNDTSHWCDEGNKTSSGIWCLCWGEAGISLRWTSHSQACISTFREPCHHKPSNANRPLWMRLDCRKIWFQSDFFSK